MKNHIKAYEDFVNESGKGRWPYFKAYRLSDEGNEEVTSPKKEFYRLPKKVIYGDLYDAKNAIENLYDRLAAGNDLSSIGELENIIDLLQNIKSQAKKFKSNA